MDRVGRRALSIRLLLAGTVVIVVAYSLFLEHIAYSDRRASLHEDPPVLLREKNLSWLPGPVSREVALDADAVAALTRRAESAMYEDYSLVHEVAPGRYDRWRLTRRRRGPFYSGPESIHLPIREEETESLKSSGTYHGALSLSTGSLYWEFWYFPDP